jgi:hypothetical protein
MSEISKEDVLKVARELNFYPTEKDIEDVIMSFEEESDNDPSGNLQLWIENLLYSYEVPQRVPATYHSSNPKPTDADQGLVDRVIEDIKNQFQQGDVTVLDELLKFVPIEYLKGSLPET